MGSRREYIERCIWDAERSLDEAVAQMPNLYLDESVQTMTTTQIVRSACSVAVVQGLLIGCRATLQGAREHLEKSKDIPR